MAQDDDERRQRRRDDADEDLLETKPRRREARPRNRRLRRRRGKPEAPRQKVSAEVIIMDRVFPLVLIAVGLVLSLVAAGGVGGEDGAGRAVAFMAGGLLAVIPVTIGTLMAAGMLLGIDYGELKGAILKLAAIASINNCILWIGEWTGMPYWVIPIAGIACFGLFLFLFELDFWEAGMSLVAVGLIQFFAKLMLIALMLTQARNEERKNNRASARPPVFETLAIA